MRRMNIGDVGVHAHRTIVNSCCYNFPCVMVTPFQLSCGMLSDHSVDHWYLSLHVFWCFPMIQDANLLLSKIREWVVWFTYSCTKLIVWVRNGVMTIPTTPTIHSRILDMWINAWLSLLPPKLEASYVLKPSLLALAIRSHHLLLVVSRRSTRSMKTR